MEFGQGSELGKEINMTLWVGPFGSIKCTIVMASTAECVINMYCEH